MSSWKLPTGDELEKQAKKYGVGSPYPYEKELQKELLEIRREYRAVWLLIIAFLSALASVFSAIAAWVAVSKLP